LLASTDFRLVSSSLLVWIFPFHHQVPQKMAAGFPPVSGLDAYNFPVVLRHAIRHCLRSVSFASVDFCKAFSLILQWWMPLYSHQFPQICRSVSAGFQLGLCASLYTVVVRAFHRVLPVAFLVSATDGLV
jgi:hypothetical protein